MDLWGHFVQQMLEKHGLNWVRDIKKVYHYMLTFKVIFILAPIAMPSGEGFTNLTI